LALTAAIGLAACGGGATAKTSSSTAASGGGGSSPKGTLVVADLAPFTGADAALGPTYLAACYAATGAINRAGGVLGHKLSCKSVDTRGDPADAVPATRQMFASTPNLVLVIGVTSDEAASVVPIINHSQMVVFAMTGQSAL
jgi:ABC-type branched-subunit amino acid transport system substrate-binding protein